MLEVMRRMLCMTGTVEGELCLLDVPEVIRCVLLCMLEAMEGEFCLLQVPEVMHCVLCWRVSRVG